MIRKFLIKYSKRYLILLIINIILIIIIIYLATRENSQFNSNKKISQGLYQTSYLSRDFLYYKCKNKTRVGDQANLINNQTNPLSRVNGSWFVCLDYYC